MSKSKYDLCAQMGTFDCEAENYHEAIKYWIWSVVLQFQTSQLLNDEPFLQLSYIAEAFGLIQITWAFRRIVDEISPSIKPRLLDEAVRRLYRVRQYGGTESIKQAIVILDKNFISS